jgi:putative ABC transport system ATP-binding protein
MSVEPTSVVDRSLAGGAASVMPLETMRDVHGSMTSWQRARSFLALERADIGVVVVYAITIGLLSLATPVAVQALVNTVAFGSLLQPIVVLTLLLAIGLTSYAFVRVLQVWTVETILQRIFVRALADAGRRLARVDIAVLDRVHAPDVLNRIFEIPPMQKSLAVLLVDGTGLALQTVVGLTLLAVYHPLLLAFSVALLMGLALVVAMGRGAAASALAESQAKYDAAGWLEHLARIPTAFRSARGLELALERTDRAARRWLAYRRTHFRKLLAHHVAAATVAALGSTALLGVGGYLVLREQLTLGQLVAAEIVVGALSASFFKLGKQLEAVYDVTTSARKLGMLVDLPGERSGTERLRAVGPARVDVQGLAFAFPDREPVLEDVDLEVRAHEHVAILGEGGSGKSTLIDVIFGLRRPTRGRVLLDGLDLRQLDLAAMRERIVLVRDAELLQASLLENLRLFAGDVELAHVQATLELVGLDRTVRGLPKGLDTELLPSGAPLSPSESRRLALARALLARPRLLLIDGALDRLGLSPPLRERLLRQVFAADAPWTAVVITGVPHVYAAASRRWDLRGGAVTEITS